MKTNTKIEHLTDWGYNNDNNNKLRPPKLISFF